MSYIKNKLVYIKTTKVWFYFILYFIKPIYEILWQYIINFHGKILYFLWFIKKKELFYLGDKGKLILKNDQILTELAGAILQNIIKKDLIKISRNEIEAKSSLDSYNKSNAGDNAYLNDIFSYLNENIKDQIISFASSDLMISTAARYIKVFPVLAKVLCYHNIPKNSNLTRGAMLWHKDDFGYKSLDIFLAITNITHENGPLITLENKDDLGVFRKSLYYVRNAQPGERNKINIDDFFLEKNKKIYLLGKSGSAMLIDSFSDFHRGGHCISGDRVMLRLSYQTVDCTRFQESKDLFIYYDKIKKKDIKSVFLKYLFFKNKNFFIKNFLADFLIRFYKIFSYKTDRF